MKTLAPGAAGEIARTVAAAPVSTGGTPSARCPRLPSTSGDGGD